MDQCFGLIESGCGEVDVEFDWCQCDVFVDCVVYGFGVCVEIQYGLMVCVVI